MLNHQVSLVHPIGNSNSRAVAMALKEAELLREVVTTIAFAPNLISSSYLSWLPSKIKSRVSYELSRRSWFSLHLLPVYSHPCHEIVRIILTKTNLSNYIGVNSQRLTDYVYYLLDKHVAEQHLHNITAIYAYEDGAATTFSAAKQKGILCLYDLPILFYRMAQTIQKEEAELFPEFATSLQALKEPAWKLRRKEREIELADHIFVASSITQQSLLDEGVDPQRISVIPYGAPTEYFKPQNKPDQQFRVLFVGRVGARKGVHYLLQAWKKLQFPKAELLLVGVDEFPQGWLSQWSGTIRYIPSVPHFSLNEYYAQASVFVFPSLVEGFGLVLLEAMACGIPIITTPNTAGPDIISDGVEGFIIPIRDIEALQEKLDWCYRHPEELHEMGKAARHKAEKLSWDLYRHQLVTKVQDLIQNR